MGMKRKDEALRSLRQITKTANGTTYTSWSCYLGTDKLTHRKIRFERATKDELKRAIDEFYAAQGNGLTPKVARDFTAGGFADYQLARQILDAAGFHEATLVEAARAFVDGHKMFTPTKLLDAYTEYVSQYSAVQKVQRSAVENRVGLAIDWFGRDTLVSAVTTDKAKAYLSSRFGSCAPKTWNNNMSYLKSFFSWCLRQKYCAENPMAAFSAKAVEYHEPEFVRADDLRQILDTAVAMDRNSRRRNQIIWSIALSFFNGVRSEELLRIQRGDVNLDEGYVRITPKGFQHGTPPRIVYLTDAAKAWMIAYPVRTDGPADAKLLDELFRVDAFSRLVKDFAERNLASPVNWPHNAGRHSFVTMHIAMHGDPRRTEMIVGTSAQMRVKHYQGLATRKEAEEYFAVLPDTGASPLAEKAQRLVV